MTNKSIMKAVTISPIEKCPVCNSLRIKLKKLVNEYPVWKCVKCKLYWVPNVTDVESKKVYCKEYFQGGQEFGYFDYLAGERNHRFNAQHILKIISTFSDPKGRLLDVGCAYGFFLDEARKIGWDVEGVECSAEGYRYATDIFGLQVQNCDLSDVHYPAGCFDVVAIIGTIEHLRNPIAFLKEAARILKKDGLLILTTLDTNSLIRIFRFKPPEHLYYFSRQNLCALLAANGFKVEYCRGHVLYCSLAEVFGLLLGVFTKPKLGQAILKIMPWKARNLKVPNNEMLIIAKRDT